MAKNKSALLKVKFLKDFGSYKKGDVASYHISTIKPLIDNKTCEKV